jgi:hypothetical protein
MPQTRAEGVFEKKTPFCVESPKPASTSLISRDLTGWRQHWLSLTLPMRHGLAGKETTMWFFLIAGGFIILPSCFHAAFKYAAFKNFSGIAS